MANLTEMTMFLPVAGGKARKVRVFVNAEEARAAAPPSKKNTPPKFVHFVYGGTKVVRGEVVCRAKCDSSKIKLADGTFYVTRNGRLFPNAFAAACAEVKRCRSNLASSRSDLRCRKSDLTRARALLKRVRNRTRV